MHWLMIKVLSWFVGDALANSDRVKTGIATAIATPISGVFALLILRCQPCAGFLTPELAEKIALGVAGAVYGLGMKLMQGLDKRDVAAPGEVVEGGAVSKEWVDTRKLRGDV